MNRYRTFHFKDSNFRIRSDRFEQAVLAIRQQRGALESYIAREPSFGESLTPVGLRPDAPEIARRMAQAACRTGVGPMAAVAGTIAQMAAEAALVAEATEALVENGGDLYLASPRDVCVALYAGQSPIGDSLAFAIPAERLPVAVCSSSSRMGHSLSLGDCDLATVVSTNASLADAAATLAANLVRTTDDIDPTLGHILAIPGILGVLLVKDDRIGLAGDLPPLVRNADLGSRRKITRDRRAGPLP
jgi:ApbE superfamily uncharacterized protein (UPF0280 family)